MDLFIVVLLIIVIILLGLVLVKLFSNKNDLFIEKLGRFELNIYKNNNELKDNMEKQVQTSYNSMSKMLNDQLYNINNSLNNKISENFKKTNETFTSIVERLTKIDEAQKNIENLSTNIVSLQSILSDKTARGSFGEVQLKNILHSIFGVNDKVYKLQYTFPTGSRVDAIIFAPEPLNKIGIDSKFPLENYRRAVDSEYELDTKAYLMSFKSDLKKHIDDISSKYIIAGETDQAIMFLPAEAVFAYMQSYCLDVVEYANKKNVWITSPTTLIATLTTMQVVMQNIERDKHTKVIQDELQKLSVEFTRYSTRFDKLNRSIKAVNKDIEDITITSNKITNKFNKITNVDFEGEGDKHVEHNQEIL